MDARQKAFAERAIRRERLFLALSGAGVAAGIGLIVWAVAARLSDPAAPLGTRVALGILVLLNARQNLRQARFAGILRSLLPGPTA